MTIDAKTAELEGVIAIAALVEYQPGAVVSRTLVKKSAGTFTAFAFDAGEGLSEHTAPYDALVLMIEGDAEVSIAGTAHRVGAGQLLRLPANQPHAVKALTHGPLMIAFLGTVIGLERGVALGRSWAYGGPIASGLGALALAAGVPGGTELMLLGSMVMVAAFVAILGRQVAFFTVVVALGALCWVTGQALWLAGQPVHRVVWWWAGFLVLTIVGERLDLSRLQRPTAASRLAFVAAVGVLLVGLGRALLAPDDGMWLVGAGFVALAAWLGAFDEVAGEAGGAARHRREFVAASPSSQLAGPRRGLSGQP
jgi:quercetin dioxygenase-like cupin family protein